MSGGGVILRGDEALLGVAGGVPDGFVKSPRTSRRGNDLRYSQSLEAGLGVLAGFTAERPARGVNELGDELGLRHSTSHRYLVTLLALGYLEQSGDRKYRLAAQAGNVGINALAVLPVGRASRGLLERLRDETRRTVSLGVLQGTEVLYVERVRGFGAGQREIDLGILGLRAGWRLPAHRTSLGKLLLAYLPEPQRKERVRQLELRRGAPNAITTKAKLAEELERIRERGLALSDRELVEQLVSIAAPVRDAEGAVVAALALETHTAATTSGQMISQLAAALESTAARLSEHLSEGMQSGKRNDG
jgi:IclR family transcriptional regulator, pca regulon regulatory protein